MEFAAFEVSRRLYRLSNWTETSFVYTETPGGTVAVKARGKRIKEGQVPAYDLGFLVRQLPASVSVTRTKSGFTSTAAQMRWRKPFYDNLVRGDRPEDTTADLLIDMWERGLFEGTGMTQERGYSSL